MVVEAAGAAVVVAAEVKESLDFSLINNLNICLSNLKLTISLVMLA